MDRTVTVRLRALVAGYQRDVASAAATTRALEQRVAGTSAAMAASRQPARTFGRSMANTATQTRMAGEAFGLMPGRIGGVTGALGTLNPMLIGAGGLAAGLGVSVAAASKWETAFTGVEKTVEGTTGELAALEDGLRQMSTEMPTTAVELAGIAEAAGQLGIETDNIEEFTRVMADLGVATNMSSTEAATALARLANITQMSQDDFDRLGSTVVDLGNNFATTEAEIVEMAGRIAGAGTQIGLSEADIAGFATALSSLGIRAEAGGTAISKVMIDIASEVETGGDKLAQFAEVAGMSSAQFSTAFRQDAAGAISEFIAGLGRMEESGGSTLQTLEELGISEVRMRDALLRASGAGDLLTDALERGNVAWEENIALTEEAERAYGTTAGQWQRFKNNVTDGAVEMGQALEPFVKGTLGQLNNGFSGLRDAMESDVWSIFGRDLGTWGEVIGDATETVIDANAPFLGFGETAKQTAEDMEWMDPAARSVTTAFDDVSGAAEGAAGEVQTLADVTDELSEALDRLLNDAFSVEEAQDALAQSYADLTEQVKGAVEAGDEGARSLEGQSQAARDNRAAIRGIVEEAAEMVVAMSEQDASSAQVEAALGRQRARLIEVAEQLGINVDELGPYLSTLDEIPDTVGTLIDVDKERAQRDIGSIQRSLDRLPSQKRIDIVQRWTQAGTQIAGLTSRGGITQHAGGMAGSGPVRRMHDGGGVGFGTLATNEIPTILERGEFVVRKEETARNLMLLEAINAGRMHSGGQVAMSSGGASQAGRGGDVHVHIQGVTGTPDELVRLVSRGMRDASRLTAAAG